MKTKYFIFAASALVALASCSNEEYIGDNSLTAPEGDGSIQFSYEIPNATRADKVGSDAATALQNQFIVYGTKHESAEAATADNDEVVFKNYVVEYGANTAGQTASNTNNWEYVGKTPYAAEKVNPTVSTQTIKYWDYSAAQGYTFYGIASKADITAGHVKVTNKITSGESVYDKGYSVSLDKDADMSKLFVSDRLPVAKTNYNKPVTLKFRNFGSRVRVGFYETIPGYKVKINKFYVDADAAAAVTSFTPMGDANTTNFAASLQNISKTPKNNSDEDISNIMTVSYYNGTNGPENQVKLTATTVDYDYSLVLGTGIINATELKTSAGNPTWDNGAGLYTTVYPFEANSNPMLVKVDFTLTSEDGSGETIVVEGANVVIPTQYVKWKSNYAYTYLFKISNNTNGKTGDVQGLYPITFDAVVVDVADDKTQETISTFEDYSITTYANGSKVTVNDEYKSGETIYIVKTNNASAGAVVAPTAIGDDAANKAQVYKATTTGDAISEATVLAKLTGSPNGITLAATTATEIATLVQEVPAADGPNFDFGEKGAVKFTPTNATASDVKYVYVYTRQKYVAPTYTADNALASATYEDVTYYFKTSQGVYYAAEGINADNFETYRGSLYKQTAAGTAGLYDIKVINVKGVTP